MRNHWKLFTTFLLALPVMPLSAQPVSSTNWLLNRFSFTIGGGSGIPGRDLEPLMNTSPLMNLAFGYRLTRNFQVDAGLDTVFHAASVDFSQSSIIGNLRVRDNEYFVPMGGRVILPFKRFEIFAGGGAAYFDYSEQVSVPGGGDDSSFQCNICVSRNGWGYYATAGVMTALDRGHHLWLGTQSRYLRAETSGAPLGSVPGFTTRDQWINTAAVFTVRFPW